MLTHTSSRVASRCVAVTTLVALACAVPGAPARATKAGPALLVPASAYRFEGTVYDRLFAGMVRPRAATGARFATARRGVAALAGAPYSIVDLDNETGVQVGYPLGVNNKGDIVFYENCECVGNDAEGDIALVMHDNGTTTTIFDQEAGDVTYRAIPYAINNTGDEAGQWSQQGPVRALFNHIDWTPTRTFEDVAYADNGSFAFALNDANVSVGQAPIGGVKSAALFSITPSGNQARPKALLPPKGTSWIGSATGINNAGTIVGYGTFGQGQGRALKFALGGFAQVLPVGAAGVSSSAQAINQHGDVVGNAGSQAFLYRNNRVMYLPRPAGETAGNAVAYAINASDEIVGDIVTSTGRTAFLYVNGTSYDLNSLLAPNSGWTIGHAAGINDAGEIVGTGFDVNTTAFDGGSFSMKP